MTFAIPLSSFSPSELQGKLRRWPSLLPIIEGYERELGPLADHDLRKRSLSLRYRAKSHEPLDRLLPEAYALVREAAGRGVHLATVNDYLGRRDAEWMGPTYDLLGLKVGVSQSNLTQFFVRSRPARCFTS